LRDRAKIHSSNIHKLNAEFEDQKDNLDDEIDDDQDYQFDDDLP